MNVADKIRRANIEVHNREASIYDGVHPEIFGLFEQSKIIKDLSLIASIVRGESAVRVLDIGCGTGNLTLKYLQHGYYVKAVDISPEMIATLKSKLDPEVLNRAEFLVSDAEDALANSGTFGGWDIISFSAVLHHLPDYKIVLAQALRQLRTGGVLYVCHEPLRKLGAEIGLVSRFAGGILDGIDTFYICTRKLRAYVNQSLRTRRVFKRFDYSWSDFHARLGIDAEEILRELELRGARTLLYKTYKSHYSSLLARLDAHFTISEHSHFRFILQR